MSKKVKRKLPDEEQTQLYDRVTKLQTCIIESIFKLKKDRKGHECKHCLTLPPQCENYDPTVNYYDKFWKMFLMNEVCEVRIKEMKKYIESQGEELVKIENFFEKRERLVRQRWKKNNRRTAQQIEKRFKCPYQQCWKAYGSNISLNLHIRLKHNGSLIIEKQEPPECSIQDIDREKDIPKPTKNLQSGFIQDCMQSHGQRENIENEIGQRPNPNRKSSGESTGVKGVNFFFGNSSPPSIQNSNTNRKNIKQNQSPFLNQSDE